ncbi:Arm DNA-binding domain-containing protein [Carnobacterium maltaromaticum]|uniref:Arm DNA-binding domain-containing protein n=1 Tax=Carnobacterium maltaromaticum TaxID=2751 RepID=UPI0039AF49BE
MASYQKYKTAKGEKWLFKMDVGINPLTGKKKRTTRRGFKTKKEAQIASASLLQDINNGTLINESKILFEDFIDKWFEHYKLTGVKNSTLANRKTTSIPNLKRLLGKYPISKIGMVEYQNMLNTLFDEDYADNTIIAIDVVAKLIFKYAVQLKYIKESPTLYAIVPKKVQSITDIDNSPIEEHYLEKNELNTFLNVIQTTGNKFDYAVFLTLSFTGE